MIAKFDISTINKNDSGCWTLYKKAKYTKIISDHCIINEFSSFQKSCVKINK